ncbi:MAG: hypothetical protein AMJ65_03515 [Phycisphaerae bacterium SG8_4]|jgi:tetratricopeptide (TPR) repeat protein|nr:MAG: hypothetical protein AMJ65_03515 [Phycisphaerae bacterium SG8_4]
MNATTITISDIYRLGQQCQSQGDLAAAKAHYIDVISRNPDHADALHCLGNIDAREGRLDDAERLIRKAIALDPMKASFINSLGNILKARGVLDEAARLYEQAARLRSDLPVVQYNLAEVHLKARRYDDALEACFKALDADPNFAGAYDMIGRVLNNKGELAKAVDAFRRAAVIRPEFWEAYDHMGHVFRAQGKLAEARDAFEHAIAIDKNAASPHHNLATVLMLQGDIQGGIKSFERASELRPRHIPTLLNLGLALHTDGRLNGAVRVYKRAIEIDPSDPALYLNLGLVFVEQRRIEQAERRFNDALRLDPGIVRAHAELAALYEESNRLQDLEAQLAAGLAIAPDDPRLNLEAAKADRRAGRIREGIDRLKRFPLDSLEPRLAEQFRYQLGHLHDRANQVEEAFEHFLEANSTASKSARAQKAEPDEFLRVIDRLTDFFASNDPATWPPTPPMRRPPPAFLLGFPRSGTTLLDVVLDSHPRITTVEEQLTVLPVIERLRDLEGGFPGSLETLGDTEIDELRALYYEVLDRFAPRDDSVIVVDKAPIRTVFVGVLWRLFPDAKFVFCQRHPCDVVLSNFMQSYTISDAFAHFLSMDGTVNLYDKVMGLWRLYVSRLPLQWRAVRYEALVDDLALEIRETLDFLDVPWDPAVLDYPKRAKERGTVNTNSYHQVIEPIYDRSRGRWRRYKRQLEPYMSILRKHIAYFGYED